MNRRYTYFLEDTDKESNIAEMKKYVENKQELDTFLEKLIRPFISEKSLKILDACCGIGHIIYLLKQISPRSNFIGVDQTPYLIEEARKLYEDEKISFEIGDIYDLPIKYSKEFDISIIWKTISWIPYYDELLRTLCAVTKEHIFLSGLFYDYDIDFEIKVREFGEEAGKYGFTKYYNVYSLPSFKKFVYGLGAKNIEVHNFDITIDIPRMPLDQMGTYTLKLEDGRRLQISGAVVMSWKIIRIDL